MQTNFRLGVVGQHFKFIFMTKVIAYYLPQFHEIPENDQWWGKGFTEWTNVRNAQPLFEGHDQPRVPLNNRYYRLDDVDTLRWQAELLNKYNVDGLCFYHYWFNGKLLLEKPLELLLNNPDIAMPFCLAWANQEWTRAWDDGGDREIIMPQEYGGKIEWEAHFQYLLKAFRDGRYIKVDNSPVILIYMATDIPNLAEMLAYWRQRAVESSFAGLHLVSMNTSYALYQGSEFDKHVDFEPTYTIKHGLNSGYRVLLKIRKSLAMVFNRLFGFRFFETIFNYDCLWASILKRKLRYSVYPGAFVDWDNTPRKNKRGLLLKNQSPRKFSRYFAEQYQRAKNSGSDFIFVNAWNEWAEGTYLEPDEKYQYVYLEAVRDAKLKNEN